VGWKAAVAMAVEAAVASRADGTVEGVMTVLAKVVEGMEVAGMALDEAMPAAETMEAAASAVWGMAVAATGVASAAEEAWALVTAMMEAAASAVSGMAVAATGVVSATEEAWALVTAMLVAVIRGAVASRAVMARQKAVVAVSASSAAGRCPLW